MLNYFYPHNFIKFAEEESVDPLIRQGNTEVGDIMLEIKPVKLKKRSQPINILSEKKVKFFIKLHNKEELSSD